MYNIIKQASIDLDSIPPDKVVKVASVVNRLRAWYNSLMDPAYKSRIAKLQTDSAGVKVDLDRLQRYMTDVNQSIANGDIDKYNYALSGLKESVRSLASYLSVLDKDASMAEASPEAKAMEQDRDINHVLFRETTLQNDRIGNPIRNAFRKAGLEQAEIDEILKDPSFLRDIEQALMNNAQMMGSEVVVGQGKNQDRIGELHVVYQTNSFNLTNYPVAVKMIVMLTDMSKRQKDPRPLMSVTRIMAMEAKKITTANIDECFDCGLQKTALVNPKFQQYSGTGSAWAFDTGKIRAQRDLFNMGNKIPAQKTPVTRPEFIEACKRVWPKVFGEGTQPNEASLGMLWAQAALETGHFQKMYNYNFGNIKASAGWSQNNKFTGFKCGENLKDANGNVTSHLFSGEHPMCFFRAYDSLDAGVINFLGTLKKSYGTALNFAAQGDPIGFTHALKQRGYFTADEDRYAKGIASLYGNYRGGKSEPVTTQDLPPAIPANIQDELRELQQYLSSYGESLTDIVKQSMAKLLLPSHNIVINIKSDDDGMINKYAVLLADCLENTIDADTKIEGNKIVCCATGSEEALIKAIRAIDEVVSREFYQKKGFLAYGICE
jgi:hypothetical protein